MVVFGHNHVTSLIVAPSAVSPCPDIGYFSGTMPQALLSLSSTLTLLSFTTVSSERITSLSISTHCPMFLGSRLPPSTSEISALIVSYGLPSDTVLGSDWSIPCQPVPIDKPPFFSRPSLDTMQSLCPPHNWQAANGLSQLLLSLSPFFLLIYSPVMLGLTQLMGSSPSQACDALASFLRSCRTKPAFCNDLNMNRVETCCETNEEQQDAVLCHILNGLCIL